MATEFDPEDSRLMRAILNTVVYADIFDYPLTAAQIQRYLTGVQAAPEAVSSQLEHLSRGVLRRIGEYYPLVGRENIIDIRRHREQISARTWPQARRYGRMIASLPFVRMLAITGSLAMNNIEEQGDIDFLIVTTNDRLWLCRLLVLCVVWLAARQKVKLCPNYLISERALEFSAHSLYAAHEFAQMLLLSGPDVYEQMLKENSWVKNFLPNANKVAWNAENCIQKLPRTYGLRRLLEVILASSIGAWLEHWEMRRKIEKLSRENNHNPEAVFSADVCKGHANRHGQHTEMVLGERLAHLKLEIES